MTARIYQFPRTRMLRQLHKGDRAYGLGQELLVNRVEEGRVEVIGFDHRQRPFMTWVRSDRVSRCPLAEMEAAYAGEDR